MKTPDLARQKLVEAIGRGWHNGKELACRR